MFDLKHVPPTSTKRTSLQLLLTWEDDRDPKWYPCNSSLGDNEQIHAYLDMNKLRKHIPQKYTFCKDHSEEIARRKKRRLEESNKSARRECKK